MSVELFWPRSVVVSLCETVEMYRSLWDPRHADYPRHRHRQKLFSVVAQELKTRHPIMRSLTGDQASLKFKKLKSYFIREHKKVQTTASGSAGKIPSKWEFYNCLTFLSASAEETLSVASWLGPTELKFGNASSFPTHSEPQEQDDMVVVKHEVSSDDSIPYTEPLSKGQQSELVHDTTEQSTCCMSTTNLSPSPSPASQAPQSPGLPSAQCEAPGSSSTRQKKTRKSQYDQAINLALEMASQQPTRPSYAASVASVVENLIKMCPIEQQQEFGFFILESAHKKYADVRNKNTSLLNPKESIIIQVNNVESNA